MAQWGKLLEENYDKVVDALETAAKEMIGGDPDSVYRLEINDDGSMKAYWTQEDTNSADALNGTARVVYDFHPTGDDEEDYLRATEDLYAPGEVNTLLKMWKRDDKNA